MEINKAAVRSEQGQSVAVKVIKLEKQREEIVAN